MTCACGKPRKYKDKCATCYARDRRQARLVPCPKCGEPRDPRAELCRPCWLRVEDEQPEKRCTGCKETRPIEEFTWRKGTGNARPKRRARCVDCNNGEARDRRAADPGRHKGAKQAWAKKNPAGYARMLIRGSARALGLDPAVVLAYYDQHDGRCDICGRTAAEASRFKRLSIDHCHATGVFRGLCCTTCNIMMGHSGDLPERLEAGARYLRERAAGAPTPKEAQLD